MTSKQASNIAGAVHAACVLLIIGLAVAVGAWPFG